MTNEKTIEELNAEFVSSTDLALNQVIQDRKKAYPSIEDQLDTLYHGGYDAWHAQIQAIKQQYPKPTGGSQ